MSHIDEHDIYESLSMSFIHSLKKTFTSIKFMLVYFINKISTLHGWLTWIPVPTSQYTTVKSGVAKFQFFLFSNSNSKFASKGTNTSKRII